MLAPMAEAPSISTAPGQSTQFPSDSIGSEAALRAIDGAMLDSATLPNGVVAGTPEPHWWDWGDYS